MWWDNDFIFLLLLFFRIYVRIYLSPNWRHMLGSKISNASNNYFYNYLFKLGPGHMVYRGWDCIRFPCCVSIAFHSVYHIKRYLLYTLLTLKGQIPPSHPRFQNQIPMGHVPFLFHYEPPYQFTSSPLESSAPFLVMILQPWIQFSLFLNM